MSADIDADLTRINKRLAVLEGAAKPDPTNPSLADDRMRSVLERLDRLEAVDPVKLAEALRNDMLVIGARIEALEEFRHRIEALAGVAPQPHPDLPPAA